MYYLVSDEDLDRLKKGWIKIEDIRKPYNAALFTWSGADVKDELPNITRQEAHKLWDWLSENSDVSDSVHDMARQIQEERLGDRHSGTDR